VSKVWGTLAYISDMGHIGWRGWVKSNALFAIAVYRVRYYWCAERRQTRPNKSLHPTATAVMPPAAQEIMPAVAVAEH
jgi:hypothetical protein